MKNPKKVLIVGNLPTRDSRSIGGATILTQRIFEFLKSQKTAEFSFLKIRKHWKPKAQIIDYIWFPLRFLWFQKNNEVISFHASTDFHITVGPLVTAFCRLSGKKYSYHFFGGNFHQKFQQLPKFYQRWLKLTILKADTVFMETLEMINYFEAENINLQWLPNSRKSPTLTLQPKKFKKRFVFISRVTPTKGIDTILEAVESLPQDYIIDIYGPLDERFYKEEHFKLNRVNYCGILSADEVIPTLSKYDVLLLPTFHPGEGYPGIIIEALSVGLPVISTKWNAMEELITDEVNGKIIPIRSSQALTQAIKSFTSENYSSFSKNALASFANFNSDLVFKRILESYD